MIDQEEPGSVEPDFDELVASLPPVCIPTALADAHRIVIRGQERGRIDQHGHRVPTCDYWLYDEHYRHRSWSVHDHARFIEFLKLTSAAISRWRPVPEEDRRSSAREVIDAGLLKSTETA